MCNQCGGCHDILWSATLKRKQTAFAYRLMGDLRQIARHPRRKRSDTRLSTSLTLQARFYAAFQQLRRGRLSCRFTAHRLMRRHFSHKKEYPSAEVLSNAMRYTFFQGTEACAPFPGDFYSSALSTCQEERLTVG